MGFQSETQMLELREKEEEIDALKLALKKKESKQTFYSPIYNQFIAKLAQFWYKLVCIKPWNLNGSP